MTLIATVAAVAGLLLAWTSGRATVFLTCGVCGWSRASTEIGLFWDGDPFVTLSFAGNESQPSSFTDTLAAHGHVHHWETQRLPPERFLADRVVRTVYCPSPTHLFHEEAAFEVLGNSDFRGRLAALLEERSWTLEEVEDALLWCDVPSCPFDSNDLPPVIADRRANAHARLRASLNEFQAETR